MEENKTMKRKATPEEIAKYNNMLDKESKRLRDCRSVKVTDSIAYNQPGYSVGNN